MGDNGCNYIRSNWNIAFGDVLFFQCVSLFSCDEFDCFHSRPIHNIYGGICVYNVAIANVSSMVDKVLGYVCVRFESYG
jgi:hypothetical protein